MRLGALFVQNSGHDDSKNSSNSFSFLDIEPLRRQRAVYPNLIGDRRPSVVYNRFDPVYIHMEMRHPVRRSSINGRARRDPCC